MKLWFTVATALVWAAAFAHATAYVDENFEGGVPPPHWESSKSGAGAGWDGESGGPSGTYARGWATSTADVERWAKMDTYVFDVPPNTTVEFRFDYKYGHGGFEAPNRATFILLYAGYPEEVITSFGMELTSTWRVFERKVVPPRGGLVKARLEVWVRNPHPRRSATYIWDVDNVLVADEAYHAVAPTSLGRVKALFR
jgi:hypothetical protein